jgi:catechol 2,3-dioxygenase-like lactoylglutathione lyase family enzyme
MGSDELRVQGFDHLVLRCTDVEATLASYSDVLGLEPVRVDEWRREEVFFPPVARLDTMLPAFATYRAWAAGSDRTIPLVRLTRRGSVPGCRP